MNLNKLSRGCLTFLLLITISCSEFIDIAPPRTDLVRSTVFNNDATAVAALLDLYYQMHYRGFASGDLTSISFLSALSSDEVINGISWDPSFQQLNNNAISPGNSLVLGLWSDLYKCIYKSNAILEGLASSDHVSEQVKKQLEGEAKTIRAFCNFYLVNLFGDVPLVLTTNYKTNQNIGRTPTAQVYQQIIDDLSDAQLLLPDDFSVSKGERIRVNKGAATAMLSRVYLYLEDWPNAETQSSSVINNTATYGLVSLDEVFLKNSQEAIWQLPSVTGNTWDVETYLYGHRISGELINAFSVDDQRATHWLGQAYGAYYSPLKYKDLNKTSTEYSMVLRLAEQYLIRAEARARQGNLTGPAGAESDVNLIRNRAGLPNSTASTQEEMLTAIEQERRLELFTEWGHRWLDLKRTGRLNDVVGPIKVNWQPTAALYPIPESQLLLDPTMKNAQNPGY